MVALRKKTLSELVVGDRVIRILGGEVAMPLPVTAVTESFIICGPYTFSRRNGAEGRDTNKDKMRRAPLR